MTDTEATLSEDTFPPSWWVRGQSMTWRPNEQWSDGDCPPWPWLVAPRIEAAS